MTKSTPAAPSATLSRGLQMLEVIAAAETPLTIAELSSRLELHRSVAYRLLRTLEMHHLVRRDAAGKIHTAAGLTVLARSVQGDLQAVALPVLRRIADELEMSCFVAVAEGADCYTLVTVEPTRSHVVTQHPGTRHHLDRGAPGLAVMAGLTPAERAQTGIELTERVKSAVAQAVEQGYANSADDVIAGVASVAVPLIIPGQIPAALAVVYPKAEVNTGALGELLQKGAREIAGLLGAS